MSPPCSWALGRLCGAWMIHAVAPPTTDPQRGERRNQKVTIIGHVLLAQQLKEPNICGVPGMIVALGYVKHSLSNSKPPYALMPLFDRLASKHPRWVTFYRLQTSTIRILHQMHGSGTFYERGSQAGLIVAIGPTPPSKTSSTTSSRLGDTAVLLSAQSATATVL